VVIVLACAARFIVLLTRKTARDSLVHGSALKTLLWHALTEATSVWLIARAHLGGTHDVTALLTCRLGVMVTGVL
jgi:hypothetical protein